jgi:hypothetical protein
MVYCSPTENLYGDLNQNGTNLDENQNQDGSEHYPEQEEEV